MSVLSRNINNQSYTPGIRFEVAVITSKEWFVSESVCCLVLLNKPLNGCPSRDNYMALGYLDYAAIIMIIH